MKRSRVALFATLFLAACRSVEAEEPRPPIRAAIAVEVAEALARIAADLERDGPIAWTRHFDDAPDFFMASEGTLKFATYDDAREAMEAFGPTIATLDLELREPRIGVLTPDLASFAAEYDERLVGSSGEETRFSGYVTGLMRRTEAGWRVAQMHWSMEVP